MNLRMELVGMVMGGSGVSNQQTACITADLLEGFVSGYLAMHPDETGCAIC